MQCVICKHGASRRSTATVTVTRATTIVVIKDVPSDICDQLR